MKLYKRCLKSFPHASSVLILASLAVISPLNAFAQEKPASPALEATAAVWDLENLSKDTISNGTIMALTQHIRVKVFGVLPDYRWLERGRIKEVLDEQKFQASGCTDQSCAVEMGQLLGARKMVTGSLSKTGGTYNLTLSVIDIETGLVDKNASEVCPDCTEGQLYQLAEKTVLSMSGRTSKRITAPKITKPWKPLGIGIFIGGSYGLNNKAETPVTTYNPLAFKADDTFGSGNQVGLNYGIRYRLWFNPKYMIQLERTSLSAGDGSLGAGDLLAGSPGSTYTANDDNRIPLGYTGLRVRFGVSRTGKLSEVFNWNAGVGIAKYSHALNPEVGDLQTQTNLQLTTGGQTYFVRHYSKHFDFSTAFLSTGVEWKPHPRVGWNLSGSCNIKKETIVQRVTITGPGGSQVFEIWRSKIPALNIDTFIALYF
ncbi:MAG: CsgG/HfaB family protein [Elusimicrobiota bacterium]|nr:CsgG/HfaB family protein [Elusimicrobiota bacterium]